MYIPKIGNKNKKHSLLAKMINLIVLVLIIFSYNIAYADELSDLNAKISETNSQLTQIKSQKKSLATEIAGFDAQIYAVQLEINKTQFEINQTNSEIAQTTAKISQAEADLLKQKDIMKEYLRTMYIAGQTTTFELVVTSKNFSDFVDQSEYLNTMQQKVQETADKIVALKTQLEGQKKELEIKKAKTEQLKQAQVMQRQDLDSQRAQKDAILAEAKGSETQFQKLLTGLYAQRAALSARNNEIIGGGGGTGGYPWANSVPDGVIDTWSFYSRECTSYAAWKSANLGPISASDLKKWGSTEVANGGDWARLGIKYGYNVTYTPVAGSVVSYPYQAGMPYGHVAYVESVNADGTYNVSEYNYSTPYSYGTRARIPAGAYGGRFITR